MRSNSVNKNNTLTMKLRVKIPATGTNAFLVKGTTTGPPHSTVLVGGRWHLMQRSLLFGKGRRRKVKYAVVQLTGLMFEDVMILTVKKHSINGKPSPHFRKKGELICSSNDEQH